MSGAKLNFRKTASIFLADVLNVLSAWFSGDYRVDRLKRGILLARVRQNMADLQNLETRVSNLVREGDEKKDLLEKSKVALQRVSLVLAVPISGSDLLFGKCDVICYPSAGMRSSRGESITFATLSYLSCSSVFFLFGLRFLSVSWNLA